jgi:hypothetical protein
MSKLTRISPTIQFIKHKFNDFSQVVLWLNSGLNLHQSQLEPVIKPCQPINPTIFLHRSFPTYDSAEHYVPHLDQKESPVVDLHTFIQHWRHWHYSKKIIQATCNHSLIYASIYIHHAKHNVHCVICKL